MKESDAIEAFVERFKAYVDEHGLSPETGPWIVGVSGGVDSVTLLDLVRTLTDDLHAVHVNFGLRGSDSERDEALVRQLCSSWDVPLTVHRASDGWRLGAASRSLQEAARDLRYETMYGIARRLESRTVAVAHHQDDQVETVLLRLMRGTGPYGLAAMRMKRTLKPESDVMLVRPLLFASRVEIETYAAVRGLQYRHDRSNEDERFDRVKVRRLIIPSIREAFGDGAVRHIAEASERIREIVDDGVKPLTDGDLETLTTVEFGCPQIPTAPLLALRSGRRRLVLVRAIRRFLPDVPLRATVVARVEALLSSSSGKRLELAGGTVWRNRGSIVFVKSRREPPLDPAPIHLGTTNQTAFGTVTIEKIAVPPSGRAAGGNIEVLDAGVLDAPLSLGPWIPGERFQPLGMSGTKKISDFLTDEKVPSHMKSQVPVLRSGDVVAWIPGLRIAHPFRLTETSRFAVRVTFTSEP